MKKKNVLNIIGTIAALALLGYCLCAEIKRKIALSNSVIDTAEIVGFTPSRNYRTLNIKYNYRGHEIFTTLGTYSSDHLEIGMKIQIGVSVEYPNEYIEYIGPYNPL